jgi:hypothetical protein
MKTSCIITKITIGSFAVLPLSRSISGFAITANMAGCLLGKFFLSAGIVLLQGILMPPYSGIGSSGL